MPNWLEITLPSAPNAIDSLAARLTGHGFDCFQTEDARDFSEYSPQWDMADEALIRHYRNACRIVLYLPDSEGGLADLECLRSLCPDLTIENRKEEDWAENWKAYYKPLPIGNRLLIHPAWLPLKNPEKRAVFYNDPGLSFGTGLHASTRLCLSMLEALPENSIHRVLDIGCGSGILALCALKLGADNAVGIDIDPLAAEVSRDNARKNGLQEKYEAIQGDFNQGILAEGKQYDLIFSNIVADVIIALAPQIGAYLAPGGLWIASGIISPRLPNVHDATNRCGLTLKELHSEGGWEAAAFTL